MKGFRRRTLAFRGSTALLPLLAVAKLTGVGSSSHQHRSVPLNRRRTPNPPLHCFGCMGWGILATDGAESLSSLCLASNTSQKEDPKEKKEERRKKKEGETHSQMFCTLLYFVLYLC